MYLLTRKKILCNLEKVCGSGTNTFNLQRTFNPIYLILNSQYLQGLATHIDVSRKFLWSVPENWTLEQAATVPVVYTTVYYALVIRGRIKAGDKVLIHSGSGGVGQAAISVAHHHGCEIFTTVGSKEKREFLKSKFPQLQNDHFFNSRDVSFEKEILTVTKGKGMRCNNKRCKHLPVLGYCWPSLIFVFN